MPRLIRFAAALFVVAVLFSTSSCSNTPAPPAKAYMSEFSDVMARLTQVAKEQSVDGRMTTIGSITEEPNGQRVLTARRVTPESVTDYTIRFHKPATRWICARADAQETENSGGKNSTSIKGNSIEIEQLVAWLKW